MRGGLLGPELGITKMVCQMGRLGSYLRGFARSRSRV